MYFQFLCRWNALRVGEAVLEWIEHAIASLVILILISSEVNLLKVMGWTGCLGLLITFFLFQLRSLDEESILFIVTIFFVLHYEYFVVVISLVT